MRDAWHRIERWLAVNATAIGESLRPPHEGALADVPEGLRESLARHDGQTGEEALVEAFSLMSAIESRATSADMLSLLPEIREAHESVGSTYWSEQWFPWMSSGGGDYLVVDGPTGRVISFVHDQPDRAVVATSVGAFLTDLADAMEAKALALDDGLLVFRDQRHPMLFS